MRHIRVEPLTAAEFAPFGAVVEAPAQGGFAANDGSALRFDDIAPLVLTAEGGRPMLSWMRVAAVALPLVVRKMERHPRSSQMFMPASGRAFLVVVAPAGAVPAALRAFRAGPGQGVNYAPGTWHHAALALGETTDFLVLGHASTLPDCDFHDLATPALISG